MRTYAARAAGSFQDINHIFTADYSWDVPFSQWFRSNSGAKRKITDGWQVYGIWSMRTGTPLLITSGRDNYGTGTTQGQRPDLVAGRSCVRG